MSNVWRIGSNWGQWGESVLDMFMNYECVFFGDDKPQKIGDWNSVTDKDLFLICNGYTTVALGRPTGQFKDYKDSRIHFTSQDVIHKDLECSIIKICPAQIIVIPKEKRKKYQDRKRFCKVRQQELIQYFSELWDNISSPTEFQIIPRVVSLFNKGESIFNPNSRYRIPIYQRPYTWGEKELRTLLEDLREALETNNTVFMGTMQLSQPIPLDAEDRIKAYNIIDGQQRITSFIILRNVLEKKLNLPFSLDAKEKMRTLVSLGEEQKKLEDYVKFIKEQGTLNPNTNHQNNSYIRNYLVLDGLLEEYFGDDAVVTPLLKDTDKRVVFNALYDQICGDKIVFVVIETHASLSKTLKIFNTINTAGLDLGVDDLFKVRLYEYLKNKGKPDSVFDDISELYARIEQYNMLAGDSFKIAMGNVLRIYQHILFAREDLNQSLFYMSYERFFEQLFDSLLGIRTWEGFANVKKKDNIVSVLSLDDLNRIITCYIETLSQKKTDYHFRIIRDMYWETRYGYVWDFPIVARFFKVITKEQLFDFTLLLFKWLCPPSLYKQKVVNPIRSELLCILKELAKIGGESSNEKNGLDILKQHLSGTWKEENKTYKEILREACGFAGASFPSPKWKNLLCRLVEYLKSPEKDKALYERLLCWPIDIEHIQCAKDESHPEQVQMEWGKELNSLGNLVILERGLNRGIKNFTRKKEGRYKESRFESIIELRSKVGLDGDNQTKWKLKDAIARRQENTEFIIDFIFGTNN